MTSEIVLYYGCWNDAGHFLYDANGNRMNDYRSQQVKCPLGNALDSTFAPPFVNQREDVTALTHIHNWTVLSMWDRSIDSRPGSNASFVVPGKRTEAEVWALARAQYPQIVGRLKAARALDARLTDSVKGKANGSATQSSSSSLLSPVEGRTNDDDQARSPSDGCASATGSPRTPLPEGSQR